MDIIMCHDVANDGHVGYRLTISCDTCGCGYCYCDGCDAVAESATPDEGCRDNLCGCHTDTRDEL